MVRSLIESDAKRRGHETLVSRHHTHQTSSWWLCEAPTLPIIHVQTPVGLLALWLGPRLWRVPKLATSLPTKTFWSRYDLNYLNRMKNRCMYLQFFKFDKSTWQFKHKMQFGFYYIMWIDQNLSKVLSSQCNQSFYRNFACIPKVTAVVFARKGSQLCRCRMAMGCTTFLPKGLAQKIKLCASSMQLQNFGIQVFTLFSQSQLSSFLIKINSIAHIFKGKNQSDSDHAFDCQVSWTWLLRFFIASPMLLAWPRAKEERLTWKKHVRSDMYDVRHNTQ